MSAPKTKGPATIDAAPIPAIADDADTPNAVIPPVVVVSRFKADLARSLELRAQQLLDHENLAAVVPTLDPLEAFFLIKEFGVDEAAPILTATSSEQLQAFIDLDCWQRDELQPDEIDAWLAPFAQKGPEELATAFFSLDEEVQIVFLSDFVRVYPRPRDDEDNPEGPLDLPDPDPGYIRRTSSDTFFFLDLRLDDSREIHPQFLLEALYSVSVSRAFGLLMALRWEMLSQLHERAYEVRQGRVEEMGFPSLEHALRIFSKPPARPTLRVQPKARRQAHLPAVYAAPLDEDTLLSRAMAFIRDEIPLSVLEDDLRNLINYATIAYGGGPGNLRQAGRVAEYVRDTVSLGLELLLKQPTSATTVENNGATIGVESLEDPIAAAKAAARLLMDWSIFNVFRHGMWPVLELQSSARAVLQSERFSTWRETPESQLPDYGEERLEWEFVDALLKRPPRLSGYDPMKPANERAFASQQDLDDAAHRVDGLVTRFVR